MLTTAALLAAGGLFLLALTLLAWVAFRFYTVAIFLDSAILREIKASRAGLSAIPTAQPTTSETLLGSQLRQFITDRLKPTDGDFVVNSDEELFIQEQIKNLRDQGNGGITDSELEAFVRQAVTEKG